MLKYTIYYIFFNVIFGIFKINAYLCNIKHNINNLNTGGNR